MNPSSIKLIIFDLDGTLYVDQQVISGAIDTVKELRERGYILHFTFYDQYNNQKPSASFGSVE